MDRSWYTAATRRESSNFLARHTFAFLQIKLKQRQVWMGQLLDFVLKHGNLQQDVRAASSTRVTICYTKDRLNLERSPGQIVSAKREVGGSNLHPVLHSKGWMRFLLWCVTSTPPKDVTSLELPPSMGVLLGWLMVASAETHRFGDSRLRNIKVAASLPTRDDDQPCPSECRQTDPEENRPLFRLT